MIKQIHNPQNALWSANVAKLNIRKQIPEITQSFRIASFNVMSIMSFSGLFSSIILPLKKVQKIVLVINWKYEAYRISGDIMPFYPSPLEERGERQRGVNRLMVISLPERSEVRENNPIGES